MRDQRRRNYLVGYSGHAFVVAEAALLNQILIGGYADKKKADFNPFNLEYVGNDRDEDFRGWKEEAVFILGIGDNNIRADVSSRIRSRGLECLTVIHPDSYVSTNSSIGSGAFVARGALVNPFCKVGNDVIINTGAVIEHECIVQDGCHVAPGAVLAGNVTIGVGAFVGANSVVKQGVSIGANAVVGAGSVVVRNIPSGALVYGNPASLQRIEQSR
ncbi:MAG: acetyltransferase [Cyclobacteriaceae bacterium]